MKIEFNATIAATSSAFKVGDEGASRLSLDIPVSDMSSILRLIAFGRGKELSITVDIKGVED